MAGQQSLPLTDAQIAADAEEYRAAVAGLSEEVRARLKDGLHAHFYRIAVLTRDMRAAQQRFYRQGRKQEDLKASIDLERQVDAALKAVFGG